MKSSTEELQRNDHDTLIRIETNLKNLSTDVKIMGDGLNLRVADHEIRMQKIEMLVNQTNPIETIKEFRTLQQQTRDYFITANTYRIIAGFVGGLAVLLLSQIPNWLKILGWIK